MCDADERRNAEFLLRPVEEVLRPGEAACGKLRKVFAQARRERVDRRRVREDRLEVVERPDRRVVIVVLDEASRPARHIRRKVGDERALEPGRGLLAGTRRIEIDLPP